MQRRDLIRFANEKLISYLESLGWAMQLSVEPIQLSRHTLALLTLDLVTSLFLYILFNLF